MPAWSLVARPPDAPQRDQLGEGPFWDAESGRLYWVDIVGRRAQRLDPASGAMQVWRFDQPCSYAVPTTRGDALVALASGLFRLDFAMGGLTPFATPDGDPGNRANDCGLDPQGRLIFGSMANNIGPDGEPFPLAGSTGGFWCVHGDGRAAPLMEGIGITNSVAFSPDGSRFYCADSLLNVIWSFAYDPDGPVLSDRQVFVEGGPGGPDGSSMDADGCLWNARWGAARIIRYRPDGTVDRELELPVAQPSSCVFGGPDLKTLYITSARQELDGLAPESLDGGLFAVRLDVAGAPRHRFEG